MICCAASGRAEGPGRHQLSRGAVARTTHPTTPDRWSRRGAVLHPRRATDRRRSGAGLWCGPSRQSRAVRPFARPGTCSCCPTVNGTSVHGSPPSSRPCPLCGSAVCERAAASWGRCRVTGFSRSSGVAWARLVPHLDLSAPARAAPAALETVPAADHQHVDLVAAPPALLDEPPRLPPRPEPVAQPPFDAPGSVPDPAGKRCHLLSLSHDSRGRGGVSTSPCVARSTVRDCRHAIGREARVVRPAWVLAIASARDSRRPTCRSGAARSARWPSFGTAIMDRHPASIPSGRTAGVGHVLATIARSRSAQPALVQGLVGVVLA
jgi:hypothetical protein